MDGCKSPVVLCLFGGVGHGGTAFEEGLWIRIRIGSVFRTFVDPYSEYGSGSTQVNLG